MDDLESEEPFFLGRRLVVEDENIIVGEVVIWLEMMF